MTTYELLLGAGIRYVSFRPRSELEIHTFLTAKIKKWDVFAPDVVEKVIERLRELSYVNDAAFAQWWIDQRSSFRPKGSRALMYELQKKGVSKNTIESCLKSEDELTPAKKVIQKKLAVWSKLPDIEQKNKMYSFLSSRGFSSDTIHKIIDSIVKKDYNRD